MAEEELEFAMKYEDGMLVFERHSPEEKRRLIYKKDRCIGCGMCSEACPTKAIALGPIGAINKNLVDAPYITIDHEKCVLCGICSAVCLFNAIDVEIDGVKVRESPDFVNYERVYIFNQEKCKMKDEENQIPCEECKLACPRGAITFAGIKEIEGRVINTMEREEGDCVYCTTCERACPTQAIKVNRIFEGEVVVDQEACQGCGSCEEICPTGAIYLPKKAGWEKKNKVEVLNDICCFCSACEKVCPAKAIDVKRSKVRYTAGEKKSWTKAWEKTFNSFLR